MSFWTIWGFWGAFLTPFGPLGTRRGFSKKIFYSAKLHMKIHFAAKYQENLMDGSPAISLTDARTHARTDETDNYSPFPTKVGGLIKIDNFHRFSRFKNSEKRKFLAKFGSKISGS